MVSDYLKDSLVELYKRVATELPPDVIKALKKAEKKEEANSLGKTTLQTILKNIELAKKKGAPICQDTGTPIWFVEYGHDYRQTELRKTIEQATREATRKVPLRPNAVDTLTGKNSGDNTAIQIPVIYFREREQKGADIGLILKGGGSENIGQTYKLPNAELKAGRDLEGIRRCVLDACEKAQGLGCPPMIVSVAAGSPKDLVAVDAKIRLLRPIDYINPNPKLRAFEKKMVKEINELGIGPGGFGGKTTALAVFLNLVGRHPASYFVEVSFFCWASRRGAISFVPKKS